MASRKASAPAASNPAHVAVYEHSFEVTWPGARADPADIVSVNVFLQPYVYVYTTVTPSPAGVPVIPHSPWLHGPMEPISMQSAGLSPLYCNHAQQLSGRTGRGGPCSVVSPR